MKTKFKKIFIVIILSLFLYPSAILAGTGPLSPHMSDQITDQWGNSGLNANDTFTATDMEVIIANVIKTFLSLLGVIFIVLMLIGGYNWMTAQGDESKVEKAKATIQRAIIGLIIVVSTYSITYTIFKAL